MKYSVETTPDGYIETLEIKGKEYKKRWSNDRCKDDDFYEQMEVDGYDKSLLDAVYDNIDGSFFASEVADIKEIFISLN